MKIFFRYLFLRLVGPFFFIFMSLLILWIVLDLYNTMENFIDHKVKFGTVAHYYALQVPIMLIQVLPAAVLFATLFTLLSLNRRSELVALQAGGLAPLWLLAPFLLFGVINVLVLFYDMSGPSARADAERQTIMSQVKGDDSSASSLHYVDEGNHRAWRFESFNIRGDIGKAKGVTINIQDAEDHDIETYAAKEARWTGQFWRLIDVHRIEYAADGTTRSQENFTERDLPDITTTPKQLSLIASQPEDLTLGELSEYIASSTQTPDRIASYRTQWWYRVLYPFSVVILMLYALVQGGKSDRRSPAAGIGIAIGVLLIYGVLQNVFMAAGKNDRLSPFISVAFTEFVFLAIGLHWLAVNNGWYWQVKEWYRTWKADNTSNSEKTLT